MQLTSFSKLRMMTAVLQNVAFLLICYKENVVAMLLLLLLLYLLKL